MIRADAQCPSQKQRDENCDLTSFYHWEEEVEIEIGLN